MVKPCWKNDLDKIYPLNSWNFPMFSYFVPNGSYVANILGDKEVSTTTGKSLITKNSIWLIGKLLEHQ